MVSEAAQVAALAPPAIFRYYGERPIVLSPLTGARAQANSTWVLTDTAGHTIPAGTNVAYRTSTSSVVILRTIADVVVPAGRDRVPAGAVLLEAVEIGASVTGCRRPRCARLRRRALRAGRRASRHRPAAMSAERLEGGPVQVSTVQGRAEAAVSRLSLGVELTGRRLLAEAPTRPWSGALLLEHLVARVREGSPHLALNAHTLWSLLLSRPRVLEEQPHLRRQVGHQVERVLDMPDLNPATKQQLAGVAYAVRLARE